MMLAKGVPLLALGSFAYTLTICRKRVNNGQRTNVARARERVSAECFKSEWKMAQVGKPIPRLEDARFLQGNGNYVDDIHMDRMLYAAVFRSAWPHGRVRRIHTEAAAALPGVIGVFTQVDFAGLLRPIRSRIASMPGFEKFLQLPIATEKVRYVGEPMAVAVATSPYLAEDAASVISAEVEELDAILDWEAARTSDLLVHELAGTNFSRVDVGRGDAAAAFRTATMYDGKRSTCSATRLFPWRRGG
jgi:CO/xanthine dehydrogenase Mo-binding subunit